MITLSTILYEGNFDQILTDDSWFFQFSSQFITEKTLIINNLDSSERFLNKVNDLKLSHKFNIVYVDLNSEYVINKYNLGIDKNTTGYYYTIPYFVLIENTKTKYILNVASDCMSDIKISDDFLADALQELQLNNYCSTTMIAWVKNNKVMLNNFTIGKYENIETFKRLNRNYKESDKFNYTFNFTDQLFMGDIDKLKLIDFNISESISNKIYNGPHYGGNSFEKRMVGHQIKNNVFNCVYKGNDYYIHDNKYFN